MRTGTKMLPFPWEEECPECGRKTLDVETPVDGSALYGPTVQCRRCNWKGTAWFDGVPKIVEVRRTAWSVLRRSIASKSCRIPWIILAALVVAILLELFA